MKYSMRFAILLLPLLLGCGGGSSPAPEVKDKGAATPPAPAPVADPAPPPPKIPDLPPALPKPSGAPPTSAPKELVDSKPPTPAAPAAPVATDPAAPKKSGKPDEFDPDIVGGKAIGTYVKQLDSANKDDVIEALNALKFIPLKAKKYLPKITELTKSTDKDIAQEAADAVKTINGK